MSWSSKYTRDTEGNKIKKSTYEPHIVREGYFFHDLREEELSKSTMKNKTEKMKKEISDYLDSWLKHSIEDVLFMMSKSYDLDEGLTRKFGLRTQDVFDYWSSDLLKSILNLIK